ncbi:hypothetical protein KXV38_008555, partial [Aspergillus fumigatus]
SWSLHIGSAVMGISGSLIFGGYDSTREIGDIGTYDTTENRSTRADNQSLSWWKLGDAWGNEYPNQDWLKGSEVWDASLSAPQRSGSSQNNNIAQANRGGVSGSIDGNWGGQVAMNMTGLGVQITGRVYFYTPDNGIAIPNSTLSVLASANMTYPDGKVVPLDMGFLSLGAREAQRWDPY